MVEVCNSLYSLIGNSGTINNYKSFHRSLEIQDHRWHMISWARESNSIILVHHRIQIRCDSVGGWNKWGIPLSIFDVWNKYNLPFSLSSRRGLTHRQRWPQNRDTFFLTQLLISCKRIIRIIFYIHSIRTNSREDEPWPKIRRYHR